MSNHSTAGDAKPTNDEREAILAAIKAGKSHESFLAEVTEGGNHPAIIATETMPNGAGISWVDWSKVAEDYHGVLRGVDAAIIAMGGKPESPAWDDWDITDLLRLGDAAHHVRGAYGATLTIELPKTQLKRGPKPLTQDELMEIAWELETAKERDGTPNYIYIQRNPHITKHSATKAIQFITDNPSIYGKFREKKMLQSRRR